MPEQKREQFLGARERALEEAFFSKQNAELAEKLRAEHEREEAREGLAKISGLADDGLLDKLAGLAIGADTWAAVSLIHLVEVAWANGSVEKNERRAILAAAEANGVTSGTPSFALLEGWLDRRPDGRLLEAWGEYVVELCGSLSDREKNAFRDEVMGRARAVAEAAGGLLGLGNKVSPEEKVVLSELEKAFAR